MNDRQHIIATEDRHERENDRGVATALIAARAASIVTCMACHKPFDYREGHYCGPTGDYPPGTAVDLVVPWITDSSQIPRASTESLRRVLLTTNELDRAVKEAALGELLLRAREAGFREGRIAQPTNT